MGKRGPRITRINAEEEGRGENGKRVRGLRGGTRRKKGGWKMGRGSADYADQRGGRRGGKKGRGGQKVPNLDDPLDSAV